MQNEIGPRLLPLENVTWYADVKGIHLLRAQIDKIMVLDATVQNIDEGSSLHPAHKMLCYADICNPRVQPHSSELMLDIGSAVSVLMELIYQLTKSKLHLEICLKKAILVLHCLGLMHCWITTLVYPCNSSEKPIFISHQQKYKKESHHFFMFSIEGVLHVIEMKIMSLLSLSEQVKILTWKARRHPDWLIVTASEEHVSHKSHVTSASFLWMTDTLWPLKCN